LKPNALLAKKVSDIKRADKIQKIDLREKKKQVPNCLLASEYSSTGINWQGLFYKAKGSRSRFKSLNTMSDNYVKDLLATSKEINSKADRLKEMKISTGRNAKWAQRFKNQKVDEGGWCKLNNTLAPLLDANRVKNMIEGKKKAKMF